MFLKSIRKKSSVIMSEFDYKCKTVRRNKGIICRENGEIVINKIKILKIAQTYKKRKSGIIPVNYTYSKDGILQIIWTMSQMSLKP